MYFTYVFELVHLHKFTYRFTYILYDSKSIRIKKW